MSPWLVLSLLVVVVDQLTKYAAETWLTLHQPLALMPGFNLTLTYNPGAAFSFLSEAGGWQRWFFAAVAAITSVVIVVWLHRLPRADRLGAAGLALVLGGALGNLWDRLVPHRASVVDFIDLYYQRWHWPAFNIADSAITLGVVLLLASTFLPESDRARRR